MQYDECGGEHVCSWWGNVSTGCGVAEGEDEQEGMLIAQSKVIVS